MPMPEDNRDSQRTISANRLKGILQKFYSFVSVDVVDSTGMKVGETEEDVIFSFLAYQKTFEETIKRHQGNLISITGDGVMARFISPQDAVLYAQALLQALPKFNSSVQLLKNPFRIRVGVNTGPIFVDSAEESATLQLLPSSTIDIAGYLQKHAPVNSAWISQSTMEQMENPVPGIRRDHVDKRFGFAIYSYSGAQSPMSSPKKNEKKRILIVEDEPLQAFVLAQGFETLGNETAVAFDGEEGILQTKIFKPDLIVLDIGLPRKNGWDVLRQIKAKQLAPGASILMLARRYTVEDIESSFAMGASACIKKPIDLNHLMKKAQAVLAG